MSTPTTAALITQAEKLERQIAACIAERGEPPIDVRDTPFDCADCRTAEVSAKLLREAAAALRAAEAEQTARLPQIKSEEAWIDEVSECLDSPLTPRGRDLIRTVLRAVSAHSKSKAESQLAALRTALTTYGRHKDNCATQPREFHGRPGAPFGYTLPPDGTVCDCGLSAAISAVARSEETPKRIIVDRDADILIEMRAYLDTLTITGDNIGDIRRSLFVPWDSMWNGWVRDETAARETAGKAQETPKLEVRQGPPYHPYAQCCDGCGFDLVNDAFIMRFCEKHQPELCAEATIDPPAPATETKTLADMVDSIKTNWSASMSGEHSNGDDHASDYDVLTIAIKALRSK